MFGWFSRLLGGTFSSGEGGRLPINDMRQHLDAVEFLTARAFVAILAAALLYAFGIGWGNPRDAAAILAAILLATLCGAAFGGVFGFLFGIPRVLQQSTQSADSKDAPAQHQRDNAFVRSNSNLEEISDWLTKIIVGLGLIHLTKLFPLIEKYRGWVEANLQGFGAAKSTAMMVIGFTIAGAFTGFLLFYIETRTRISILFSSTELLYRSVMRDQQRVIDAPLFETVGEKSTGLKPVEAIPEDRRIRKPPGEGASVDDWAAWAASRTRAGELDEAAVAWRKTVEIDKGRNVTFRENYAQVLQALGRDEQAMDMYGEARACGGKSFEMLRKELVVALYVKPPRGFQRALEVIDLLTKDFAEATSRDVWIQVWHLCALGQSYGWGQRPQASTPGRALEARETPQELEQMALNILNRISLLDPDGDGDVWTFIRQLLDPVKYGGDPSDNDLAPFNAVDSVRNYIVQGPRGGRQT